MMLYSFPPSAIGLLVGQHAQLAVFTKTTCGDVIRGVINPSFIVYSYMEKTYSTCHWVGELLNSADSH